MSRVRLASLQAVVARRPAHALVAALAAGLAAAPGSRELAVGLAAVGLLAAMAVRAPVLGLATAAVVLAGSLGGEARLEALTGNAPGVRPGQRVEARAMMLERPRRSRFGWRAAVQGVGGPVGGERLLARAGREVRPPPGAGPGVEVAVTGTLRAPRSRPGAALDWPAHLRRRGITLELAVARLRPTGRRRGGLAGWVDAVRRRAERGVEAGLSPAHAALARGMVLGQDEQVPEPVREDFRRSGLAHILAVSGQNVMLLCALALPGLIALGLGPRARLAALLGLVALYVPLAGAGPSLQRAGVMGAAGIAALLAERPGSRVYALLLAAAVTLALNPAVAAEPGWQLSFAAVAAILVLAAPLRRACAALPGPLAEGVAVTVAATLGTAPLLAHHFGSVSVAALPANVLALPAVTATMWLGMLQAAVGQLGDAGGSSLLAAGLGQLNGLALRAVTAIATLFADPRWAAVEVSLRSPAAVAGVYGSGAAVLALASHLARRAEPRLRSAAGLAATLPARVRIALVVAAAAGGGLMGLWALGPGPAPDRLTVSFLDVGQGDATLVQHPAGGAILFDGGPPEAQVVRLLRQAGVRRLSAVVATHQSRDHDGGLAAVVARVPTDLFVDGGDGTADPSFRALRAAVARRGIRRVVPRAGQTLRAPGLRVRFLGPPPRPPGPPPEDANERALVTVVSADGLSLFLSGDAESPSLLPLDLPRVDAMKVPHHGSRDEGLPELLARLRPRVAAIEVGEGNGYGHPAPQSLATLRRAVPDVRRTDRDGTVRVSVDAGRMKVTTAR